MKMKSRHLIICLIIICLGSTFIYLPAQAADPAAPVLATNPQPSKKTPIELRESSVQLDWYEERVNINGVYRLVNPTDKKITLTMQLQTNSVPDVTVIRKPMDTPQQQPLLTTVYEKQVIEARYEKNKKRYLWEITFAPEEELDLLTAYAIINDSAGDGLNVTGFSRPAATLWGSDSQPCTILINLVEIHPGQITSIQPKSYRFSNNALVFGLQPSATAADDIRVAADVYKEKSLWETLLTEKERNQLGEFHKSGDFLPAANLFAKVSESAPSTEKEALLIGQAYYLEKAQKQAEAEEIWKELYDNESKSPRVYWSLGKLNAKQPSKIKTFYNKVKELEVHPLIQSWLLAQLPDYTVIPALPEITNTSLSFEESKNGITLKSKVTDKDGDIKKATLTYHWENDTVMEYTFSLHPYRYEYELDYFIPATGALKWLYYELVVTDENNNMVSSGQGEAFYLNEYLPSETVALPGAILVMADYEPAEQDKVYKWFKSYLKMAKEAEFVPVETKSPYFIFLGKKHQFVENYKGQLFVQYTETPFVPGSVENNIHRYFLSSFYGAGWNTLPEKELNTLGDGLMLGKGMSVLTLKYLQAKDDHLFAALLAAIGQGQEWTPAIQEIFKLSPARLRINVLWHAYGNVVLAVIIIFFLAWLGKTGYLVRFVQYLRTSRQP